MPRFEVCIIETREHFFEIEAESLEEAEREAEHLDTGDSIREAHREQSVDYVQAL